MQPTARRPCRGDASTPLGEIKASTLSFFSLPRELRDEIYGYMLTPEQHVRNPSGRSYCVRIRDFANISLLRVSQQFKAELVERAEKSNMLVLLDVMLGINPPRRVPFPPLNTRRLEAHILLDCNARGHRRYCGHCDVAMDLLDHRAKIRPYVDELEKPCFVYLNLYIRPHSDVARCEHELLKHYAHLTNMDGVVEVNVYHQNLQPIFDFSQPRTPVMTYSRETQTLQRVAESGNEAAGDS